MPIKKNVDAVCTGNLFNFINEELKIQESILKKLIFLNGTIRN